jgi:hypothetical protein
MLLRMEHANIRVESVDEKARFLTTAFPEFEIRAERAHKENGSEKRWIHLGTQDVYVKLGEVVPTESGPDDRPMGVGHLGYVVDDVESVANRLRAAGYKVGQLYVEGPGPSRKRFYGTDPGGVEWEFVEYLTDDPEKRNSYE